MLCMSRRALTPRVLLLGCAFGLSFLLSDQASAVAFADATASFGAVSGKADSRTDLEHAAIRRTSPRPERQPKSPRRHYPDRHNHLLCAVATRTQSQTSLTP
jgi:hypothetical protein